MKLSALLTGGVLMVPATVAAAQPAPSEHAQHQAAGQHPAETGSQQCCSAEMMRKMMTEMTQKHQRMGMSQSKPSVGQQAPATDEHRHQQQK